MGTWIKIENNLNTTYKNLVSFHQQDLTDQQKNGEIHTSFLLTSITDYQEYIPF